MTYRKVLTLDQLWAGEKVGLLVDGKKILLINIEQTIYAYEDRCAHQAVILSNGRLEGHVLTCRVHEWQYDACTGEGINPIGVRLQSFPVKLEGEDIYVDVAESKN